MGAERSNQHHAAQKFWGAFKSCVEENRVRPERSSFYVKWAQAFVDFLPEKRLRNRSRKDIEAFLVEMGKKPGIMDWQVAQAGHALKILYETFLPGYVPQPLAQKKTEKNESKTLVRSRQGKTTAFLDCGIPGEAERLYSPLLEGLKSEIRSRHYSIRTETAYLDWVRRFMAFHGYADPGSIDAAVAVKEYLDYLAITREVAASTQNQALNALVFFYRHAIKKPFDDMGAFVRAKRPQRLPDVLTRDEIMMLLDQAVMISFQPFYQSAH
jgi:hypothetical protein